MSDLFDLRVRSEGEIGILETQGYLNNMGAEKVADVCDDMVKEGVKYFVLNLEKSRAVSSIGISILIEVLLKVRKLDGKVAFCCASPTVTKTLHIMGLLKASAAYDTEAEAVQALEELNE